MGKRIESQRAGKGGPPYGATQRALAPAKYPAMDEVQKNSKIVGQVVALNAEPGHTGVLAQIMLESGKKFYVLAAESLTIGQNVEFGKTSSLNIGNVLYLKDIPEGCPIFAVENVPGDGGMFAKSSGLYALVMTKDEKNVFVKMPSGKTISMNTECRATVGCVAGGGRIEKPLLKAGANWHKHRARHKKYPNVRGVAMNPVVHPFGGSQHHAGKSKSTSRNAPPGRKVGAIASKRTGRRKK